MVKEFCLERRNYIKKKKTILKHDSIHQAGSWQLLQLLAAMYRVEIESRFYLFNERPMVFFLLFFVKRKPIKS